MASSGNVLSKVQTAKKSQGFFNGLITGSFAATALCGTALYIYFQEDINKRHKVSRAFEILKYGVPERPPPLMFYSNHVLSYDPARKTPVWVAEHLTKDKIEGDANRRRAKFQKDPSLCSLFSSTTDDFWNSGWSRGHMAPAANSKFSQEAMDETFYLTNVIPQDVENNTGFWNRLEIYCRDLTKKYTDVRLITGPLYLPQVAADKKKYIKYEVIGENDVAVPTHMYKIILAENRGESTKYLSAFIVPNVPISSDKKLHEYQVSLDTLEKKAGIKFFHKLNTHYLEDLCSHEGCRLMDKKEFARYYLSRKMENSRSLKRLEKIWQEIELHGLKKDDSLQALYEKRKEVLQNESNEKQAMAA